MTADSDGILPISLILKLSPRQPVKQKKLHRAFSYIFWGGLLKNFTDGETQCIHSAQEHGTALPGSVCTSSPLTDVLYLF